VTLVTLSQQQTDALDRSITPIRMSTYLTAAGQNQTWARNLYRWDRELSVAVLGDLAILEVALRNAMNEKLSAKWGPQWYASPDVPLDDRSEQALATAYARVKGNKSSGRIVASCMFGFWRGLLDKGGHIGKGPRKIRCDYERVLWRGVLDKAFPGGRAEAKKDGIRWDRRYALSVVSRINELRNRVAHHESLINGFPLPGQHHRVTAKEAHADCMRLAAMLDRDLHSLLAVTSRVPGLLANKPTQ
jgi:hypothetical protein